MSALRLIRTGTTVQDSKGHEVYDVFNEDFKVYQIHYVWSGGQNGSFDMAMLTDKGEWVNGFIRGAKRVAYTHTTTADSAYAASWQMEEGLGAAVKGASTQWVLNPYSNSEYTTVLKNVSSYSGSTVFAMRYGNATSYDKARHTGFLFKSEYSLLNAGTYYIYGVA